MILNLPAQNVPASAPAPAKVVYFLAGNDGIHAPGGHAYLAGCQVLADGLSARMPSLRVKVLFAKDWPKDAAGLPDAGVIVMYSDGNNSHFAEGRTELLSALARKGVGLVCIHWAVAFHEDKRAAKLFGWMGGRYRKATTKAPNWTPQFLDWPEHPITRGIKPFALHDEWYHSLELAAPGAGLVPILQARTQESKSPGDEGAVQTLAWAYARTPEAGEGRSFAITGAHHHRNWMHDGFRNLVLNAVVWVSGAEVPREGVASPRPTEEQMLRHLEFKAESDREEYAKQLREAVSKWEGKP